MLDRDLKEHLIAHIKQHPTDASEVLAIVSDALAEFEAQTRRERNSLAWQAAHTLVGMLPPLKKGQTDNPAMLLDAAFTLFPRGFDSRGSQVLDTFAARFLTACRAQRAQPLRLDWIAMTRGRDCAAWYAEHVEPRLI